MLVLILSAAVVAESAKLDVTPIQKVTTLLKGLQEKVAKEGQEEAAAYDKYACFCKEQATEKQDSIEKSKAKILALGATIKAHTATKTKLGLDVAALTALITNKEKAIKDDTASRKAERAKYDAADKDIVESIALNADAIQQMKDAKGNLKNSDVNLLQVNSKLLDSARRIFGSNEASALEKEDQAPAKFEFQGNGIIASLEKLVNNFKKMKAKMDADEVDKVSLFDSKTLGNNNEKQFAQQDKDEKNKIIATEESDIQSFTKDEDEEVKDQAADASFLRTLTSDCENKAQVFDQRSQTRSNELTAMTSAIAQLDGDVKANEDVNKKLVGLVQSPGRWTAEKEAVEVDAESSVPQEARGLKKLVEDGSDSELAAIDALDQVDDGADDMAIDAADEVDDDAEEKALLLSSDDDADDADSDLVTSFIQKSSDSVQTRSRGAIKKAQALLQEAATDLNSGVLRGAAARLLISGDHFAKVRGFISDLVKKLKDDAASEATQKGYCDKAMKKGVDNRDKGQADKEQAHATIATLTAKQMDLKMDIVKLTKQIAENTKSLLEATELRSDNAAANADSIKGAKAGKVAVDKALQVLSAFYNGNKDNFLQLNSKKYTPPNANRDGKTLDDLAPDSEGSNYAGAQAESKGITGMLEVISADFERTDNQVTADELNQVNAYKALKKKTNTDTNAKAASKKTKNGEVATAQLAKVEAQTNLKDALALWKQGVDKLDALKAQCVEGEETWAERAAARKKEIGALKDAMEVLDEIQA